MALSAHNCKVTVEQFKLKVKRYKSYFSANNETNGTIVNVFCFIHLFVLITTLGWIKKNYMSTSILEQLEHFEQFIK